MDKATEKCGQTSLDIPGIGRLHWQNLSEHGEGSILRNGRAILFPADENKTDPLTLKLAWFGAKFSDSLTAGIDFSFVNERDITLNLGLMHIFSIYFAASLPKSWKIIPSWDYEHGDRALSISLSDDGVVFLNLWDDPWNGCKRFWSYSIPDLVYGPATIEVSAYESGTFQIELPEGWHKCSYSLFKRTRKRPRRRRAQISYRANVKIADGIPVPGRGENSYDGGEDRIFNFSTDARSKISLLCNLIEYIEETRMHRGGENWTPEKTID